MSKVTAEQIREAVGVLASRCSGLSLMEWDQIADVLLGAARQIESASELAERNPAMPVLWGTQAKYDELIFAVGNKYTGESRHETVLRYIRAAESQALETKETSHD